MNRKTKPTSPMHTFHFHPTSNSLFQFNSQLKALVYESMAHTFLNIYHSLARIHSIALIRQCFHIHFVFPFKSHHSFSYLSDPPLFQHIYILITPHSQYSTLTLNQRHQPTYLTIFTRSRVTDHSKSNPDSYRIDFSIFHS